MGSIPNNCKEIDITLAIQVHSSFEERKSRNASQDALRFLLL
jgi:hypothetical protein